MFPAELLLPRGPVRGVHSTRIYCLGRRQGRGCSTTSAVLADLERQLTAFLTTFHIPTDFQQQLEAFVTREAAQVHDSAGERRRLSSQLDRLKELYLLGDIGQERYRAERERLGRELVVVEAHTAGQSTRITGLAKLLADVAAAWDAASPAQRNRLARLLFEEVVVQSKAVIAVKPRPELAGFFLLDQQARGNMYRTGGPDGIRVESKQVV
jgi:hypothetical protein